MTWERGVLAVCERPSVGTEAGQPITAPHSSPEWSRQMAGETTAAIEEIPPPKRTYECELPPPPSPNPDI